MQLIVRYTHADPALFRRAFDEDAEDRGRNGMTLLQLWREGDSQSWALFQIANPRAARDYLQGAAATFSAQAGVTATDSHFLETA
ncbi:hypothetical protein PANO111632_06675 [Paracoccus nototheniae]|uniref:Uncharacterized protein n=1 Tax=Paracoccus nototheniae TaxID=2489002 RepID=A0ABW4DXI2_9RHOB|nr:hypothetical protein [Paracoccus nototheniae]